MLVGQALVVLLVLAAAVGALGVIEAISGSHRVEALLSLVELMLG